MPAIPSLLGVGVYATIKVAGYTAYAHYLNRATGTQVSPLAFGATKTLVGLVGGVTYIYGIVPAFAFLDRSIIAFWVGAIPVRAMAWAIVLAVFFRAQLRPALFLAAVTAGVIWSYLLDALMSIFYRFLPGLSMPIC